MGDLSNSNYLTRARHFNRVSFRAIVAGVVVAILVQLLLTLLGLAIGMVSFNPTTDSAPMKGFGTGAIIWIILTTIIALFSGGWVSGWLATSTNKIDRILHGVLTWGIHTLLSIFLIGSSVGTILGGIGNILGSTFSNVGSHIAKNMPDVEQVVSKELGIDLTSNDLLAVKEEALEILRQTGKSELQPENIKDKVKDVAQDTKEAAKDVAKDPTKTEQEAEGILNKIFSNSEDVISEIDKEAVINVVVQRTGKSKAEATEIVNNWIETANTLKIQAKKALNEAKKEAEVIGEEVTDSIGKVAFYLLLGLLLGAGSAIWGSTLTRKTGEFDDAVIR